MKTGNDALVMDCIAIVAVFVLLLVLQVCPAHASADSDDSVPPGGVTTEPAPPEDSFPATEQGIQEYLNDGYPYGGPPPPPSDWDPCERARWYGVCRNLRGA